MADVIYVALTLIFFAAAAALVAACDRIIGPDELVGSTDGDVDVAKVAA